MKHFLGALLFLFWVSPAWAQGTCEAGATCVPAKDMKVFLEVLKGKQCLQRDTPQFRLDPINIVEDKEGRIYYSGAKPHPYTLKMSWCGYEVTGTGQVSIQVAMREPPMWGFRFRPKLAGSFLFVDAFKQESVAEAVEVGVLWEFFYWHSWNLNAATGFRSVGAGVGLDITKNIGAYLGYSFSFWTLYSNPQVGISAALW